MGFRPQFLFIIAPFIWACDPAKPSIDLGSGLDGSDTGTDDDTDNCSPHEEVCDGIDNDCDGEIDEGVTETYHPDEDGDGYGDETTSIEDCERPEGYVINSADCDDADQDVYVAAPEVCDGEDNDCDGLVDDEDDDVATEDGDLWYSDADGDGYGDASSTVLACDQPSDAVDNDEDCDDNNDTVHPNAEETCDGIDNDCDDLVDDDDNEVTGTTTYYGDSDDDGYGGDTFSEDLCEQPSGYVDNADDCDDLDEAINPVAVEECDEIDNDCDDLIDDEDDDVIGTETWYQDSDEDGEGDPDATATTCEVPSGYVDNDDDCDDLDDQVNSDGIEICDEIDNDCDGLTDDDDADVTEGDTWYRDEDEDGDGDPDVTTEACEQPSGYVDNDDDCDDSGTDTDADGIEDCEDDDIDGDGLRNDWDDEPEDDSVTRGPHDGFGTDGDLSITSDETLGEWTLLSSGASSGDDEIEVDDTSDFVEGDELLVLSQQGDDAGIYEMVFVSTASSTTLEIEPPLAQDFASDSIVMVLRIPHFAAVNIEEGATLSADPWEGEGGGVVMFRATDEVNVDGIITTEGLGYRGGDGVHGNTYDPYQGESYQGLGASGSNSANYGGGGAHPGRDDNSDGGGGGAHGTDGDPGTNVSGDNITAGGESYGDADLVDWFFGSGGGGGSPDTETDGNSWDNYAGDGGNGGGMVSIFSGNSISVAGSINCDGQPGDDGNSETSGGEVGGGGGGAGGQIYLAGEDVYIAGDVTALAGAGGVGDGDSSSHAYDDSDSGGDGGTGRILIDSDNIKGDTDPEAEEGSWPPE